MIWIACLPLPSQPQLLARQAPNRLPGKPCPAPALAQQFTANQLRADSGLTDPRQTNAPRRAGGRGRASRPRILSNYNNPPHYFFRTMFCLSCVVVWFALGSAFAYSSMLCASSSSSSSASCIIASVATDSCFPTSFFVPFSMFLT